MPMNTAYRLILSWALAVCVLAACDKKTEVKSSVAELEAVFSNAPPSVASAPQPEVLNAPASAPPDANAFVRAAVSAARANDYADSVIALQAAQQQPGITAEQVMAVQRTKQAMVGELQRRAASGDEAALAQLRAIERTRSQ